MDTTKNKTAETFKVVGNWDMQSQQLKKKFSQLTDSDLKLEVGKESELLGRIGKRLDKSHEDVIALIKKGQPEKIEVAPRRPMRSF